MGVLSRKGRLSDDYEPTLQMVTGHTAAVVLDLSPKGKRLVTADANGEVALWGIDGKQQLRFRLPKKNWVYVGFIDDRRLLLGLDKGGAIHLWLLPKGRIDGSSKVLQAVIDAAGAPIRCAAVHPEHRRLLLGRQDGTAQIWSLKRGRARCTLEQQDSPVCAVAFSQRGLITAGEDGAIRFWNPQGLQVDQVGATDRVCALAARGRAVAWVESSGALRLMPEGENRPLQLQGHYGEGRTVAFRDDGNYVSGGEDGRLLLYRGVRREPSQEIQIPAPVQQVAMDEKLLAVGCAGGKIFVFRRRNKKKSSS